jgi:glycine cleavage system aminomethyltransferase T
MNARSSTLTQFHARETDYRDVAGARVPWHYGDFEAEYNAIRSSSALFDHSAVGLTRVTGAVTEVLQRVLARDVEFLTPERCMMSLMLAEDGRPIDLMTVYSFDDYVLLESSYGRQDEARAHLAAQGGGDIEVTALDDWGMLGIEGPYSWGALGRVLDPAITALPYESVLELDVSGRPLIFSRSGFTGEYGYKLIAPADIIAELWKGLQPETTPAGQRALEVAMLEVRQPVLHRETATGADVVTCGIQWLIDPTKEDFVGRASVMKQLADPSSGRTLGLSWVGDDLPAGAAVALGETVVGSLVVTEYSPGMSRWLGLATVDRDLAATGLTFDLRAGDRSAEATSLSSPYVVPASWSTPIL